MRGPTTRASALSVACRLPPLTTGAQRPPQVARYDVDSCLLQMESDSILEKKEMDKKML